MYQMNDFLIITIDEHLENLSIEEIFHKWYFSKKTIHLLKQNKDYLLNKKYVSISTVVHKNDELMIKIYEHNHTFEPNFTSIDVKYEDELLLVVDKPAYLPVYPERLDIKDSLNHRVCGYYMMNGQDYRILPLHRLDDNTSGLIIYMKSALFFPLFQHMLENNEIHKYYQALCLGTFDHKKHTIHKPIGRDRHSNKMRISSTGKPSLTIYQCLKQYDNYGLIECELRTGRRHQIRVHMASIGHPVLGDPLYSKNLLKRQALHAYHLQWIHPITYQLIDIYSLPDWSECHF